MRHGSKRPRRPQDRARKSVRERARAGDIFPAPWVSVTAARRVVGVCVLPVCVACADKTPPPQHAAGGDRAADHPGARRHPRRAARSSSWPPPPRARCCSATVSISSVDRLLANGTKLVAQAMPLPMDAAGLRDMMLSQAGLPPEVAANMDFASPSAAAFVALDGKGKSGAVMAVPARGPAEAQKIIDALGKKITTRGPATLVEGNTGGRGWLYRSGNVVVLSDEVEALARGTMLTLEARRAGAEDVTAVMYPEAIARANGTDVKTAIDKFLKEMQQKQAASAPGVGGGDRGRQREFAAGGGRSAGARRRRLQHRGEPGGRSGARVSIVRARFNAAPRDEAGVGREGGQAVPARSRGRHHRHERTFHRRRQQPGAVLARRAGDLPRSPGRRQAEGRGRRARLLRRGAGGDGGPAVDEHVASQGSAVSERRVFVSAQGRGQRGARSPTSLAALDSAAASALLRAQLGDTSSVEWTVKKETVGEAEDAALPREDEEEGRRAAATSDLSKRLDGADAGRLLGGRRTRGC